MNEPLRNLFALCCVALGACTHSPENAVFESDAQFTREEEAVIRALPAVAQPSSQTIYRAVWSDGSDVRRVYLQHPGIELFGTPYTVFMFDGSAKLMEHNQFIAVDQWIPRKVVGVEPLRVAFGPPSAETRINVEGVRFSPEEWAARHAERASLRRAILEGRFDQNE